MQSTPGHTPGHVSVRIHSEGESAVITGDFLHHPCQMEEPYWECTADWDTKMAQKTRMEALEAYAEEGLLVFGTHFASPSANIGAPPRGPNGSSHGRIREMTPTSDGCIRRTYTSGQCHVKKSTRSGRLSPHSAPIEVGPHPRRLPRCPLESSNGAPHRMRSQRRFLSFI